MTPIAITGTSALTPLGDSPSALFAALGAGRSAVTASSTTPGVGVAEIQDFDAARYATVRGMRMYNRTTRLAICAAKLALTEARIEVPGFPGEDLGLLMASTHGHLDVLLEYDRSLVASGVQRTNGALMPLAIPSAPGAMVALAFGAKAFSMTLSDGGSSCLDAMALGARWVAEGRARACIVVGAFSASAEVVVAASRAGVLAPADALRVFDRRGAGTALGEGAVAFVLERAEDAQTRGAEVRGHVCGYGAAFSGKPAGLADAVRRASTQALRDAGAPVDRVALASAGASGLRAFDRAEAEGLSALLGEAGARVPVTAVKGALGETLDAGGGFQSLVALSSLEAQKAPPIAGLVEPEVPGLKYASMKEEPVDGNGFALVTSVAWGGGCSALVLSGRRS